MEKNLVTVKVTVISPVLRRWCGFMAGTSIV